MKNRVLLIAVVAFCSLAADQITKRAAISQLKPEGWPRRPARVVEVVPGYLALQYTENPGSAFGLLRNVPGSRYILIGVGLLALVLVWSMIRKVEQGRRTADIAFGLVAGGAVGNLIDRVYIGRVVDFVLMHWQFKYKWPHYNVADAVLVAGVILLLFVLSKKPEPAPAATKPRKKKKK